ncbi:hypothetical protein [uncultured Eubacterium sp.]|uniref:hypothetical protein n=1 Tax=Eubacterium sp. TaxID=142586 RepID=UPI0032645C4D
MKNIKMTKEELVDAMLDNRITFEFDYSAIKKKKRKKKASRDRTLEFLEKLKKVSIIKN